MSAAALVPHLEGVHQTGRGRWRALCPICKGNNREKVSVRDMPDGGVAVRCFACDATAPMIAAAVGVDVMDLCPPRPDDDRKRGPRVRAIFDARDALRLIEYELDMATRLLLVCSKDDLTPERRSRLALAAYRIRSARAACSLTEVRS